MLGRVLSHRWSERAHRGGAAGWPGAPTRTDARLLRHHHHGEKLELVSDMQFDEEWIKRERVEILGRLIRTRPSTIPWKWGKRAHV